MASAAASPSVLSTTIGLANLGNTCFLNAVLQALRFAPPIGPIFLIPTNVARREASTKKEMASAFQTLMRDFWEHTIPAGSCPTLIPRGFMYSMHMQLRETGDDWYHPGQQADAAEALQYIMDSLHDSMYKRVKMDIVGKAGSDEESSQAKAIESWATFFSKEYSPIVQHFNGQTQITIQCTACGNKSERYEPWLMIKAPIPGTAGSAAPTMLDCLNKAFEPETIEDYACEKCKGRTKAVMTNRISRLPPVTILSIKRFTNAGHKVHGKITWDLDAIDFAPWMAFKRDPFRDLAVKPEYETFAVIEHNGSARGGHYRAFAKQEEQWIEYDDSAARPCRPDRIVSDDSYIIFLVSKHDKAALRHSFVERIVDMRARKSAPASASASGGAGTGSA